MARSFGRIDDFEDDSRPPVVDWVEWLLQGIFVSAGVAMIAYIGFMVMTVAMK
ncbi:hypothetical protein [Lacrimispora sp.]|uniref:hypothetical protein n=1 Tax=Lacrimispora sp. TaxID=2719234 RepID=UPI0028997558|nr:hypothetical protein [Lacrimispora sp.]